MPTPIAVAPPRSARRLLIGLFAVYLILLAWIILWKLEVPYVGAAAGLARPIKLIPFVSTAEDGASAPTEVLANLALFIPFGIYLGLLASSRRIWTSLIVLAGASLVLEITQHVLSIGSFDSTDVIVNTAGGLLGMGVLALTRRRLEGRTEGILTRILIVATVVAVIAAALYLASPLRYGQQRDVIFPSPTAH